MPAPSPVSDRDLLLGLLALQGGLLTREALFEAVLAWLPRRGEPLGSTLAERGALLPEQVPLLERLVDEHLTDLQRHAAGLRSRLDGGAAPEGPGESVSCPPTEPTHHTSVFAPPYVAPLSSPAPTQRRAGRYAWLRAHARGGLGEVSVAVDEELDRPVALKEIQPRYADHPELRERFVREARITGHLEHPGIVPVYGMGSHPDGRPYYAMRFIKGQSLHDAIAQFHRADAAPRDAGERELALRSLLTRFVAVCNAVGYAHSRGVIHRDLKPSNVMLGEYGETLVVDWGLAKALTQGDPASAGSPAPVGATGSQSTPTAMGQVVGTPAFMPPEQARGQWDQVGPASDIFALGATLYCLLTGRPAYAGADVLGQAARGEVPPARQVNPLAPAALEAVCARAMTPAPEARYASATDLAADVERWLADEPVSAYREPARQRARRWAKRHRVLVSSAGALLAAGVAGLALGLWAVNAEKERTQEAYLDATTNLARAEAAEGVATERLRQSEANFALARQAVDDCFGVARSHPLFQRPDLRPLKRVLFRQALPFYQKFRDTRPADPALRHELWAQTFRVAHIQEELGNLPEALREYRAAERIVRQLADDHPREPRHRRDLASALNNLGVVLKDLGRPREALACHTESARLSRHLAREQREAPAHRNDLARALNNLAVLQRDDVPQEALTNFTEAARLGRELVRDWPSEPAYRNDLARALGNLGNFHAAQGRAKPGVASLTEAAELGRQLVNDQPAALTYQNDLVSLLSNLGTAQLTLGQREEALSSFKEAVARARELAAAQPGAPAPRYGLAAALGNRAAAEAALDRAEALETGEEAIRIGRDLFRSHRDVPEHGVVLLKALRARAERQGLRGRTDAAMASLVEAADVGRQLARSQPEGAAAREHLGDVLTLLANLLQALGRRDDALVNLVEAADVAREQVRHHPRLARYQHILASCLNNAGILSRALGRTAEARALYDEAVAVGRRLAQAERADPAHVNQLAASLTNLGLLHQAGGRPTDALRDYTEAIDWRRKLLEAERDSVEWAFDLTRPLLNRASLRRARGDLQGARADLDESLALLGRVEARAPAYPSLGAFLAFAHRERALTLAAMGQHRSSLADWDRAVTLASPGQRDAARLGRAEALARAGEDGRAAAEATDLIRQPRLTAEAAYDAARVFSLAAGAAGRLRPLPVRERQAEARARQAVALLRLLAGAGYFRGPARRDLLDMDPDLAPLRGRDDYKRFRAALPPTR